MLDFLEAAYGRGSNLAEKRFALAGGGILTCPILTTGGYGTVIDTVLLRIVQRQNFQIIWRKSLFLIRGRKKK